MGLSYNAREDTVSPPRGLMINATEDYGGTTSMRELAPNTPSTVIYQVLIAYLETLGFKERVDMFGAPFDWRTGPNQWKSESFPLMKSLFEQIYEQTGKAATALGLSFGNAFFQTFCTWDGIDQAWKDKYVRGWISLSGTFGGTTISLSEFLTLEPYEGNVTKEHPKERETIQSWPAVAYMLPHPKVFPGKVFVHARGKEYTPENFLDFLATGPGDLKVTHDIFDNLLKSGAVDRALDPPGVEVWAWYGTAIPTLASLSFNSTILGGVHWDQASNITNEEGDGDVLLPSLQVVDTWVAKQAEPIHITRVPGMCHGCPVYTGKLFPAIAKVLTGQEVPVPRDLLDAFKDSRSYTLSPCSVQQ